MKLYSVEKMDIKQTGLLLKEKEYNLCRLLSAS